MQHLLTCTIVQCIIYAQSCRYGGSIIDEIFAMLYQLTEEGLPLRGNNWRKDQMDDQLIAAMGQEFMEKYEKVCYQEDHISRVDLFYSALALGVRLGSLTDLR